MAPPGRYAVRLALTPAGAGAPTWEQRQPLVVRADPRAVQDGMTPARFAAQWTHEVQARDLTTAMDALVARVRTADSTLTADSTAGRPVDATRRAALRTLQRALVAESVRYGRPGLQTQVQYLYDLTGQADQPVGRDAIERLAELQREVAARTREADALLGPARPRAADAGAR